jgi:3-oxoadipate enol-lactonase/4-carboxymuconolactone decarboxylase
VDELKEILLQTTIYCGVPAANEAFKVAAKALAEAE